MDVQRLRENFAHVAAHGDAVAMRFYTHLFLNHPELRQLFPVAMLHQRDRLLAALGRVVSGVDDEDELVPFLRQLGRDHGKFGAEPAHYAAVGESLLATLKHYSGTGWTRELADDWGEAYMVAATVMRQSAEEAAQTTPPWWDAEVVAHERRAFDIAVLTVRPHVRFDYEPGQSLAVETRRRPKLWRYLSLANAPREDNTIEFHVRMIDGGAVSSALVLHTTAGSVLRLGAPVGHRLTLAPTSRRDLLLVAGSTGLAPLKPSSSR